MLSGGRGEDPIFIKNDAVTLYVVKEVKEQMNEKYKNLIKNTIVFALSNIISKVVLSLLLPLYTRRLTTIEYGTAELITSLVQLVIPVCTLSIQDSVFRFCSGNPSEAPKYLKNSMPIYGSSLIVLAIISATIGKMMLASVWAIYFFVISFLTMFRSVLSLYTKATNRTLLFSMDNILYNSLLAVSNIIILSIYSKKLQGYFDAIIIANAFSISFLALKNKIIVLLKLEHCKKEIITLMLRYSYPLIFNSISWGSMHLVDKVMLREYGGMASVGIYSAASKIPSILSLITGVFSQAWTLSVIQDYESGVDEKFYEKVFTIIHLSSSLCGFLIIFLNRSIIGWIIGDEFQKSLAYIPILLYGAIFLAYSNYYSGIYAAFKRSDYLMYSSLGGGLINFVLNAWMIPHFQILGACIATAISSIYIAVYRMIKCRKFCSFSIDFKKFFTSQGLLLFITFFSVVKNDIEILTLFSCLLFLLLYKKEIIGIIKKFFGRRFAL